MVFRPHGHRAADRLAVSIPELADTDGSVSGDLLLLIRREFR